MQANAARSGLGWVCTILQHSRFPEITWLSRERLWWRTVISWLSWRETITQGQSKIFQHLRQNAKCFFAYPLWRGFHHRFQLVQFCPLSNFYSGKVCVMISLPMTPAQETRSIFSTGFHSLRVRHSQNQSKFLRVFRWHDNHLLLPKYTSGRNVIGSVEEKG